MPTKKDTLSERLTVRMPKAMRRDLQREVRQRGYSDEAELVRAVLREHQDRRKVAQG